MKYAHLVYGVITTALSVPFIALGWFFAEVHMAVRFGYRQCMLYNGSTGPLLKAIKEVGL